MATHRSSGRAWLDRVCADLDQRLAATDAELATRYPGPPLGRQPVLAIHLLGGLTCGAYTETGLASLTNLNPGQLSFISRRGTLPTESPP